MYFEILKPSRHRLLVPLVVGLSVFVCATPSQSGPNEGGTLILHTFPYQSRDVPAPCGDEFLAACIEAETYVPDSQIRGWMVFAAFPSDSAPRVSGVSFGLEYDDTTVFLNDFGSCSDFEIATSGWPAPGEGTAVTWSTARTQALVDVYGFIGYEYYMRDTPFCVVAHPTQGGFFGDDSVPSVLDPIVDYGCLGFGDNPGYLPCPEDPVPVEERSWGQVKDLYR